MSEYPDKDEHEDRKIPKSKKLLYILSSIVIVAAAALLLLIIFWMLYPYKTAELDVPVKILNENNEVEVGEAVVLEISVTKYTNVIPTKTEFITCDDGAITFFTPDKAYNLPKGNYTFINDSNVIPKKLSVGSTCRYRFHYIYKVNPIRDIFKEWSSEPFTILRRGN